MWVLSTYHGRLVNLWSKDKRHLHKMVSFIPSTTQQQQHRERNSERKMDKKQMEKKRLPGDESDGIWSIAGDLKRCQTFHRSAFCTNITYNWHRLNNKSEKIFVNYFCKNSKKWFFTIVILGYFGNFQDLLKIGHWTFVSKNQKQKTSRSLNSQLPSGGSIEFQTRIKTF